MTVPGTRADSAGSRSVTIATDVLSFAGQIWCRSSKQSGFNSINTLYCVDLHGVVRFVSEQRAAAVGRDA